MKIISWNVNGIRAILKKGFIDYIKKESPDILCLQEVKASPSQVQELFIQLENYEIFWNDAEKKGYSGVATLTKNQPNTVKNGIGNQQFNKEGRAICTEFDDFILFNIYFPNGQKDETRLKFKMDYYDEFLKLCEQHKKNNKAIIVCGDFNTAHKEIDLTHPKANQKYSGFLPIERDWIDKWIESGFIDTFRHFNKKPEQYTWWSYRMNARKKNVGWRLDYHFVSNNLINKVHASYIQSDIYGSDHCPIVLEIF